MKTTKKIDWVTQATAAPARAKVASVVRKPVKKRADVQAIAGPAFHHTLEPGAGRVIALMQLSLDDYKLKVSLPAGLREGLTGAGERLAPTLCALADFALNELERKGGTLTVIPLPEDQGGLGCEFEHGRRKGPLTIEFAGSLIYPERDGDGRRDRRASVWVPDSLLTRLEATGAELGPSMAALAAWGLAYLREKGQNLVTRAG
ncbi:hypothetical protein [Dyella ginsengisoli]|uniref:hypothetical protein n=1 Tax=Dyella ginsengisoli TaxID=363848 RepID=UPI0003456767|nr:hypothetical protein [Dyella ginsengisoli]